MRILVHDYSGHPFQVELSAALGARAHVVTHSWCEAHVSGKGDLAGEHLGVSFAPVGVGEVIDKLAFRRRLVQEVRYGVQLVAQVRRLRPDVVLIGNTPIPMLAVITLWLWLRGVPWVLWQQDVQGVAVRTFAGAKLGRVFVVVAWLMAWVERWCARRAAAIVVIAPCFLPVHEEWGTADKTTVIPNWAPLEDIRPMPRDNAWAEEHGLASRPTLLYSGTLGLKHRPELLVLLTDEVNRSGATTTLVVVSEGPAVDVLRREGERRAVQTVLEPFQPFDRLGEVLGAGDVLVVLLDESAGAFSVPSKTLSYLSAGRPVVALMPVDNPAATLITQAGGLVLPPCEASLPRAADWVRDVLGDPERREELGRAARRLAEREFAIDVCVDRFETILVGAAGD